MVRLGRMPDRAIVDALSDSLDFYEQNGQPVARRMPHLKTALTPAERTIQQVILQFAVRATSQCRIPIRAAAYSLAQGSCWTWRDAVLSAYMGNLITLNGLSAGPGLNDTTHLNGVLTIDAQFEQRLGQERLIGVWTDRDCYAKFYVQFVTPQRTRRIVKSRGIVSPGGWRVNFFDPILQSPWDAFALDFHSFSFPMPPGALAAYWFCVYSVGAPGAFGDSFSKSIPLKAGLYNPALDLPLNSYICPAWGSVPEYPGYASTLFGAPTLFPCAVPA